MSQLDIAVAILVKVSCCPGREVGSYLAIIPSCTINAWNKAPLSNHVSGFLGIKKNLPLAGGRRDPSSPSLRSPATSQCPIYHSRSEDSTLDPTLVSHWRPSPPSISPPLLAPSPLGIVYTPSPRKGGTAKVTDGRVRVLPPLCHHQRTPPCPSTCRRDSPPSQSGRIRSASVGLLRSFIPAHSSTSYNPTSTFIHLEVSSHLPFIASHHPQNATTQVQNRRCRCRKARDARGGRPPQVAARQHLGLGLDGQEEPVFHGRVGRLGSRT